MLKNAQMQFFISLMTPNTAYLTKAHYIEGKRKIAVEFSSCNGKATKSFTFFPSFFLDKGMPAKELNSILSTYNPQKFKVRERQHSFEVIASTFTDLKCLANLCLEAFGQRPYLIEPERQFLILHDWSYFDSFGFFDGNPIKTNDEGFPLAKIDSLPESLGITALQLLGHDVHIAAEFIANIARSKILRIPFEAPLTSKFLDMEIMLENILFSNGFGMAKENGAKAGSEFERRPFCPDAIEMDFSELWPLLMTKPFYNLGFESINCKCCKPEGASDDNILPHSKVRARALSDGLYFRSISQDYAVAFHSSSPFKDNRLRAKSEFYLNYIPVGPFYRGQEAELLLCDAMQLNEERKFEVLDASTLRWFCQRKESFLSKWLRKMNKSIVSLSREISVLQKNALQAHGLLGEKRLEHNLDFLFKKELLEFRKEFYSSILWHLANPKSRFFSGKLAMAIGAVQALTICKFTEILEEQHGKLLHAGNASALVRTEKPMSLAKEFSQREKIPLLISAVKKPKVIAH